MKSNLHDFAGDVRITWSLTIAVGGGDGKRYGRSLLFCLDDIKDSLLKEHLKRRIEEVTAGFDDVAEKAIDALSMDLPLPEVK